jgi:hypothetical protein
LPGFVLLVGNAQPHQVQHGGGVERDNAAEVQRRIWIAISGMALLNRLMTLRKRLVLSSATMTATWSNWG